ncbi:MAG: glycosyltransferase family 9 protein [Sedimentisphaerales bacterium]|nr:glycosyltransferase family 9 protein [Sedimentisphaerales bacterium]
MNSKKQKVLIIKVGYSETLDPEISNITSYGDVMRTTVLLHLYQDDHVTWLVDEKAYPILKNNPYIDRILIYDLTSVLQLQAEHFDTVINLEKVPGLCALADQVTAWRRYGFRFDVKTGQAEAYDGTEKALSICTNEKQKINQKRFWQEYLFEMVGATWQGQEYILGYEPTEEEKYDVGFNYKVGNKWPSKAWSMENWCQLEEMLTPDCTVSWQEGLDDMEEYFEWINSCRVLVTNDSFGLHLALALNKRVVALFSSSHWKETCFYGLGRALTKTDCACPYQPCHMPQCRLRHKTCDVDVDQVYAEVCAQLHIAMEVPTGRKISDINESRRRVIRSRVGIPMPVETI